MSYRDDLEAAQNRIAALERELGDAKQALVVRDEAALATTPWQRRARRWLGARTRLRGERVVEGEIDDGAYAELVEAITEGFDVRGRASSVPDRLQWSNTTGDRRNGIADIAISITHNHGQTRIKGEVRLGALAGGIFGGIGGGGGGGAAFVGASTFLEFPIGMAAIGLAIVGAWLGATYWSCRKLYRWSVKRREDRLEGVLDRLEEICEKAPKRDSEATASTTP
jgi:hypothetical protein